MATEYKPFPISCEHMVDIIFILRRAKQLGITEHQQFCIIERKGSPSPVPYIYDIEADQRNKFQTFNITFYWNKTINDFVLLNIVKHDS